MSTSRFDSGITLLDKVVIQLNNLEKFTQIKNVSFVYFNCKSIIQLEKLKKHPLTKNILVVSDMKFRTDRILTVSMENWEKHKPDFLQLTKNSFVIDEDRQLEPDIYYQTLKDYSSYYPMILLFASEKLKKTEITKSGYTAYLEDTIYCNINKNFKDFTSFSIEDFKQLDMKIQEISGLKSVRIGRNVYGKKSGPAVTLDRVSPTSGRKMEEDEEEANFDFLRGLPSPTVPKKLNKYKKPNSKQWLQEFYQYLKELMKRFFPENRMGMIDKILTNDTLQKNWIPCFTHFTANPNPGENYESVETIGDVTIGYCFKFYIKEREPLASESRISNLNQMFMSKKFQSKVAKEMKLQEWLITCGIPQDRMDNNEDLLEALCGTIDTLLYKKSGSIGYGTIIIYNLIKMLFDGKEFKKETNRNTDPDRTFVQQIFSGQAFRIPSKFNYTLIDPPKEFPEELWEKLVKDINKKVVPEGYNPVVIERDSKDHRGIEVKNVSRPDGRVTVTVTILKAYAEIAKKYGIDLPAKDIEIGKSTKNTKKIAEKEAFAQAKDYLIEKGMTREWKDSQTKKKKSSVLNNMDMVYEKALEEYPDLIGEPTVERTKTLKISGQDVTVYQIVGKDETGRLIPIFTLTSQDKAYEQGVIDTYLSQ
tara:strand:- start:735 stop:2675 length:1941 start_codon:yes stop_codon:yes gene_type:complete